MSKALQNFLSGVGGLLDIIPSFDPPKLKEFRSSSDDLKNIKGDWMRVGNNLKNAMIKERNYQNQSKAGTKTH